MRAGGNHLKTTFVSSQYKNTVEYDILVRVTWQKLHNSRVVYLPTVKVFLPPTRLKMSQNCWKISQPLFHRRPNRHKPHAMQTNTFSNFCYSQAQKRKIKPLIISSFYASLILILIFCSISISMGPLTC